MFEILLNILPTEKVNMEIQMYGPLISKKYHNKEITMTKNKNTFKFKLISSLYQPENLKENPNLLVSLNPGLFLNTLWKKSISLLFEEKPKDLKVVITERDENSINAIEGYVQFHSLEGGHELNEINPFREPYVENIPGIIIPCIRNSFFYVI